MAGCGGTSGSFSFNVPANASFVVEVEECSSGGISTYSLNVTGNGVALPFDPEQAITDLKDMVSGMGLPKGLTTALNAKLNAALKALDADNHLGACTALQDFQNLVNAQTRKKLTEGQAGDLTEAATQIFEHICFT